MKQFIQKVLPWQRMLVLSLAILFIIDVLSFYGLYTNTFYPFKISNYIVPVLSVCHMIYLYVLNFKITQKELSDPPMRTLEYTLYVICFVYVFKFIETLGTVLSYTDYKHHILPATFIPVGILILTLYLSLITITLLTFWVRKYRVGTYTFNALNQHVDLGKNEYS